MNNKPSSVRWIFDCHKWCPTREEWLLASSCVQNEEKERIGRFFFKRDAKNSMAGRLLMRKFLTMYSGIPWRSIEIHREEHGKPCLGNSVEVPLGFNISHHGNYTILAGEVGNYKVGVDIMSVDYRTGEALREFLRLMNKQFSEEEWKTIKKHEYSEREICRLFYRFWCLKESYLKATGSGLTETLKEISFEIKDLNIRDEFVTTTEVIVKGERLKNWIFQEIMIDQNTFAAVALSPRSDAQISRFQFLNFEELMSEAEKIIPEDEKYCDAFFVKMNSPNN